MKKLMMGALGIALVLGALALPGWADHVNEPTEPVTKFWVELEHYATNTPVDCTGQTPFTFNHIRIQPYVDTAAAPSEHWDAKLDVFYTIVDDRGVATEKRLWDTGFQHQNVAPHRMTTKYPVTRFSNTGVPWPGEWRIQVRLTTNESGQTFTESCSFVVGEAA